MNTESFAHPNRFCWTRFGVESGECVDSILLRKERERSAHDGLFLWGIGNSVGPAIRELVKLESKPRVIFSPMRSKAKEIDVSPSKVITWTRAQILDGSEWLMPPGLRVVSRASTEIGRAKRSHYALVCRSTEPLSVSSDLGQIHYERLVNLLSKNKLGHSQVTSVVECIEGLQGNARTYPIGFSAELAYPYFLKLTEPTVDCQHSPIRALSGYANRNLFQESLIPA
jgi:hypothetical protein